MDKKKFILNFVKHHKIAVISTVNTKGNPQSAVVEFGETNSLELIFDTFSNSRKYINLKQNPNVSFVIGWDEDKTVQYEGKALELSDKELLKYQKIYFAKNPRARKWQNVEGIKFFKVLPKWIRYSDVSSSPWKVFEVNF